MSSPENVQRPAARPLLSLDVPIVLYIDAVVKGGTAGYGAALGRGLRARGYRVAAICHLAEAVAFMRQSLADAGVAVHAIDDEDLSVAARLRRVGRYVSVLDEYPGCVLALMMGYFSPGGPILMAGARARVDAVVRADLQPPMPPIGRGARVNTWLKDRLVTRIVVGAAENREACVRLLGRSAAMIDVVHTGIDVARFEPAKDRDRIRREFDYGAHHLVVGTLSRLEEDVWRKGIPQFIEAAARIAPKFPQSMFLVVGDGPRRQELEQQAAAAGLSGRINFTGWRTDVPALLDGMDVFVMPSLFEGGPTTVLEAMAMRKSVVATSVGMVPEVVDHGRTGLIVEAGNVTALADALATILSDQRLRDAMSHQAREHALRNFSIDLMVERYLEVFAAALASRSGGTPGGVGVGLARASRAAGLFGRRRHRDDGHAVGRRRELHCPPLR